MCGIAGLVGDSNAAALSQMNTLLTHRGPDDSGEYRDPTNCVALAMRRLSIIDLAGGHQPMSNEDDSLWIVHNGEIYNSPRLRTELEARGHTFRTSHSDTETLLHLYEDHREEMLSHLNGMFAFVIYDRERQMLFGARDRLGIKPLYYYEGTEVFAFASELKGLLPLPGLQREIDFSSLYHYMSLLYVPGENSILRGVKRLPPGHWFKFDLRSRQLTVHRYWDIDVRHVEQRSEAEWCDRIRAELREAVKRWTLSDVPVGCSLSGGIDSAAMVGLLAESGHAHIKTYSLGFAGQGEEAWNELPLARQVARRWDTEHHELILEPDQLLDDLVQMVWHLDEPYGSGLPSWYVFRFMRETVTVGLTGTGGDEEFGNYGKYGHFESEAFARIAIAQRDRYDAITRNMAWLWKSCLHLVYATPEQWLGSRRKKHLMRALDFGGGPIGRYYFNKWYYFTDHAKRTVVLQADLDGVAETARLIQDWYDRSGADDIRNGIAYLDFNTQLADEFLMMTDRLSMAHSLEARVPYLDHTFVETVFRIPASLRTRPDNLKYLLKKSVADLLPDELLRAKKRGFVIPITLWLRGPLRPLAERLLSPERLKQQGIFRPSFYGHFVRPHLEGRANYTWQVWAALMFQLWHVVFIECAASNAPNFGRRELAD